MKNILESHVTQVLNEGAKYKQKQMAGKIYQYEIFGYDYSEIVRSGKCKVISVDYTIIADCDMYQIQDIDTSEIIFKNQFMIRLTEIENQ